MSTGIALKSTLAAVATLISGIAFILVSAAAHAAPPLPLAFHCANPVFNGPFSFLQSNGYRVETNLVGETAEGQAVVFLAHGATLNGRGRGQHSRWRHARHPLGQRDDLSLHRHLG